MRISDWSSDVCSSDLGNVVGQRAETGDFRGIARFLPAELVARKAQHLETARAEAAMERLQPFILRGEAAFGGGVDDQQHPARISGEIDVRPIAGRNVPIGDPCHRKASSWPASSASRLRRTPGHSVSRREYTTV